MIEQLKCGCGEVLNWADFGTCEHCQKPKCPDCFTMDEDAEICDPCAKLQNAETYHQVNNKE